MEMQRVSGGRLKIKESKDGLRKMKETSEYPENKTDN